MACCYNNGDFYAIELKDNVSGTIRDIETKVLNVGFEESAEQIKDN